MSGETALQANQKATAAPLVASGLLQRKCDCGQHTIAGSQCDECGKQELSLQRATRNSEGETQNSGDVPPIVHDVLRSPGQPLDAATRAFFEPRFSHDFSRVRVHTGSKAAASAEAVDALAYTVGHNVVFGGGLYQPGTIQGQRLLAHELTHTIQQAVGRQDKPFTLGIADSGNEAEREAEAAETDIDQGRPLSSGSARGIQIARKSACDKVTNEQGSSTSNKDISPWKEGWDWLTGKHPGKRYFGLGDKMTEQLRKHTAVNKARTNALRLIKKACAIDSDSTELSDEDGIENSLGGLEGVGKYLQDYSSLATFGLTGNLTATFLGSYHGCWSARMRCCDAKAAVHFHIENKSGLTSATHFPVLGYDRPRPSVGDWLTSPVETGKKWGPTLPGSLFHDIESGPMATVMQVFDWEEPLALSPPLVCIDFPSKASSTKGAKGSKQAKLEGSVTSVSWIDPSSPAGSHLADPAPPKTINEAFATGNSGFRFSNHLNAWVDSPDAIHVAKSGFHGNSGLYTGPSFKGIPSQKYHTQRSATPTNEGSVEGVEFEQVTGARTVSAGVLGGAVGSVVASETGFDPGAGKKLGSAAANLITNFPPIWTRLKLRLFANGKRHGELSEHSTFPSITFYADFSQVGNSYGAGKAAQETWAEEGWDSGNPWAASRPSAGP